MHAIGILLAFVGSSCDSLGTLLQKRAQGQATHEALLQGREEGELDYIGTCKNNGRPFLISTRAASKQRNHDRHLENGVCFVHARVHTCLCCNWHGRPQCHRCGFCFHIGGESAAVTPHSV